jgi:hypothetical protein
MGQYALDFEECVDRHRQFMIGVRRGCLKSEFSVWRDFLQSLARPRSAARRTSNLQKHLLAPSDPRVVEDYPCQNIIHRVCRRPACHHLEL